MRHTRRSMRFPIREQLCLLIAFTSMLALMVLAVATCHYDHISRTQIRTYNLIAKVTTSSYKFGRSSRLPLLGAEAHFSRSQQLLVTANLKAAQVAQDLQLFHDSVQSIASRGLLQIDLISYNNGDRSQALFDEINSALRSALSGDGRNALFVQARIYPKDNSTPQDIHGLVNVTGDAARDAYVLPYNDTGGKLVHLGDPGLGYPRELYPNLSYVDRGTEGVHRVIYNDSSVSSGSVAVQRTLYSNSTLVLGPLYLNSTASLMSITLAVIDNSSLANVLGWLTVVLDARLLYDVVTQEEGQGKTGEVLLVGPLMQSNLFPTPVKGRSASANADVVVDFVLPPPNNAQLGFRHNLRAWYDQGGDPDLGFDMHQYPAVLDAWSKISHEINNAGSYISTFNEEGIRVSVGYAHVDSDWVDWVLVFEQSYGEVIQPINQLRDIVLACVFSVVGAIIVVCFPLAHFAVKPIQALRTATQNSVATYEVDLPSAGSLEEGSQADSEKTIRATTTEETDDNTLMQFASRKKKAAETADRGRRTFKIPEKVPEMKRLLVRDELTDLTGTFNEMSDELRIQYHQLEERVRLRTAELEASRDVAHAASESKTLFIANVSHELRTPLNGIIGMCTVAMQEEEMNRVRSSLKIIYKSSDLLLHLLNDLLTFSRNSFGQQLAIEEAPFRLVDIGTQLLSLFQKQATESQVDLRVIYLGLETQEEGAEDSIVARQELDSSNPIPIMSIASAKGPADTGFLRDMSLLGDKNRVLQVLMNLVSNSLKFTPAKGAIEVRVRCRGFAPGPLQRQYTSATGRRASVTAELARRVVEIPNIQIGEGSGDIRDLLFDFEVEDTGPGVPEHLRAEIFKPFVQGDLALSKKFGGTGLGLAICSQLATLMGGKIHLRSTVGIGSTFSLSIPLRYSKEAAPSINSSLARSKMTTKPNSLATRSLREESKSVWSQRTRDPSPTRVSVYSGKESQIDLPRIVGYSQPFITDGSHEEVPKGATRPTSPVLGSRPTSPLVLSRQSTREEAKPKRVEQLQLSPPLGKGKEPTAVPRSMSVESAAAKAPPSLSGSSAPTTPYLEPSVSKQGTSEKPPAWRIRVLVAEDNKVNQEVILRMLKLEKVTDITIAEDGQQALDIVRNSMQPTPTTPPQLPSPSSRPSSPTHHPQSSSPQFQSKEPFNMIFMDIQMPQLDGIQSTRLIRELGFSAPIVALTAFTDQSNRTACEDVGMNDFLPKPIRRTALKQILAQFARPPPVVKEEVEEEEEGTGKGKERETGVGKSDGKAGAGAGEGSVDQSMKVTTGASTSAG